jgi:hypothetical protein
MTKLKIVNEFQQRIKDNPNGGGEYQLMGIPNDEEGLNFIKSLRKYLNKDRYKVVKYGRQWGTYLNSADKDKTDSFVIYIKEKPKLKKFEVTYCIPKFQTEIKEFESMGDAQNYADSLALVDGVYDVKEIE